MFSFNTLGLVQKFNDVDIKQKENYNNAHFAINIDKMITHHGWKNDTMRQNPTSMRANNKY